ncbi:MAG: TRAFAC clade GTPase domain-containing protein [Janthinobacterium lividum]
MQQGKCTKEGCPAALSKHCLLTNELSECPNWQPANTKSKSKASPVANPQPDGTDTDKQPSRKVPGERLVAWSGEALRLPEIELVSRQGAPVILATVGHADAGKTTFLGLLHTLLLRGRPLGHYTFVRSLTLLGWEKLAAAWRFKGGEVRGSTPTPDDPDYYSLLHWTLRQPDQRLREVLFPDAGGEVFSRWAIEATDPTAANVRWIEKNADAFLFFVDCRALAERQNPAFIQVIKLATRLRDNLNGRPVLVLWSRADYLSAVSPEMQAKVTKQLQLRFGFYTSFEISNELTDSPEIRQLNMLAAVNEALSQVAARRWLPTAPDHFDPDSQDTFLLYRGK